MDFDKFNHFYSEVFDSNFSTQKLLETQNEILTISDLIKLVHQFELADIILHFPTDNDLIDNPKCFIFSDGSPTVIIPIRSFVATPEKIIFSYLPQNLLNIQFDFDIKLHQDYLTSYKLDKTLFNNHFYSPQEHAGLYMEFISDKTCASWNCFYENNLKLHHAWAFIRVSTLLLWESYFFTPHY